ncbi:tautomerase family protein, partial [Bacillus cereus]|nr:tautomerase family protein [Bacillus cereus]
MPFVNVYYHENKLNKEEIQKIGECIQLALIE